MSAHYKKQHTNHSRGFTLIETIMAIFILVIAITGPLSVAYQSIKYARLAGDRAVATMLAQDAMEYIIAKKNYNIATGLDWMDGMDPLTGQKPCKHDERGCTMDTTAPLYNPDIDKCDVSSGCVPLNHNGTSYTYGGGNTTHFTRSVYIETPSNNSDERIIRVVVDYRSGIFTGSYQIRLNVYKSNV